MSQENVEFPEHPQYVHKNMCVAYLFRTFTHQIICQHPADAQEIPHFPETFTQTPCKNVVHVLGMSGKPEKKQPWCLGKCPGENAEFSKHLWDVHK